MTKIPYKPVYIEWVDSESHFGWTSVEKSENINRKGLTCYSVGYLIRETPHEVLIANSLDLPNDKFNGVMSIPKVSVIKRKYLKV